MKVCVIGTAGRREDGDKMSRGLFEAMYERALSEVNDIPRDRLTIRSGGAPWADFIAVELWRRRQCHALELELPCGWDWENHRFQEFPTKVRDPGKTLNWYYKAFSLKMGQDMSLVFEEVLRASFDASKGVEARVYPGFHARNMAVGRVDRVIAFTWGEGVVPKDGGTKHCWDHSRAEDKRHIPLSGL